MCAQFEQIPWQVCKDCAVLIWCVWGRRVGAESELFYSPLCHHTFLSTRARQTHWRSGTVGSDKARTHMYRVLTDGLQSSKNILTPCNWGRTKESLYHTGKHMLTRKWQNRLKMLNRDRAEPSKRQKVVFHQNYISLQDGWWSFVGVPPKEILTGYDWAEKVKQTPWQMRAWGQPGQMYSVKVHFLSAL